MTFILLFSSVMNISASGLIVKPVLPPMEWTDGSDVNAENVEITFLNISEAEVTIEVGESFSVQTQVWNKDSQAYISSHEIVWSVQKSSVVSVDFKGTLKGLKVGESYVRAKCRGVFVHFMVNVVAAETVPPTQPPIEDKPATPPVESEPVEPEPISVKKVVLSKTQYVYDGKTKKPTVRVIDDNNKQLKEKTHYTVKYSSGRKNVGIYKATVTFKGDYRDCEKVVKSFSINPKGTVTKKLEAAKKKVTIAWKKQTKQTSGYQIQCCENKKFKKRVATVDVTGEMKTKLSLTGLKARKTYYVRMRTFKKVKVNGKTKKMYSSWSKTKKVKTK